MGCQYYIRIWRASPTLCLGDKCCAGFGNPVPRRQMLCQSLREDAFIAATPNVGTRVGGSSPVSCSNTDIHSKGEHHIVWCDLPLRPSPVSILPPCSTYLPVARTCSLLCTATRAPPAADAAPLAVALIVPGSSAGSETRSPVPSRPAGESSVSSLSPFSDPDSSAGSPPHRQPVPGGRSVRDRLNPKCRGAGAELAVASLPHVLYTTFANVDQPGL